MLDTTQYSTALGIIHRKGLGKTRHIDTRLLWIQQMAAEHRLKFAKVLGKINLADIFAKHLIRLVLLLCCHQLLTTQTQTQTQAATARIVRHTGLITYDPDPHPDPDPITQTQTQAATARNLRQPGLVI